MKFNELRPNKGSRRDRKRAGRDASSGYGRTADRGQKGQLARTGGKTRLDFGSGQMPLFRRMPKRSFKDVSRREYAIINLDNLNRLDDDSEVTISTSKSSGLVKKKLAGVKLLTDDELKVKLTVKVNKISEATKKAAEAAGGIVEAI